MLEVDLQGGLGGGLYFLTETVSEGVGPLGAADAHPAGFF
jgi:hypothetical protein